MSRTKVSEFRAVSHEVLWLARQSGMVDGLGGEEHRLERLYFRNKLSSVACE